ncbi:Rv0361 family membrane protein [Mycolicibacterium houstonense]|uniref:Rv0361 family membrane protein n=1 Tax=Mycolicibacterium houstonense TaxID=146021 RepID=UPI003F9C8789
MTGSYQYPEHIPPQQYPEQVPSAYPGTMPPPVPYPTRRRWPKVLAVLLAVVALAGVVTVVMVAARRGPAAPVVVTDAQAQAAIQEYLNALVEGDDETVARHTLCGLYDGVKERKADLAVAGLASDAFRKQFSHVEVTGIDKNVPWSTTQAQVLFTMKVAPASGSARGQRPMDEEQQGVAQLLVQRDGKNEQVLVCSYVLRTSGQY